MNTICKGKHVLLLERDGWEYVERKKGKEAVAIIAETDDGRVILSARTDLARHHLRNSRVFT